MSIMSSNANRMGGIAFDRTKSPLDANQSYLVKAGEAKVFGRTNSISSIDNSVGGFG